jgi:two-component sensor histidine kinase/PAS domain-containing protein
MGEPSLIPLRLRFAGIDCMDSFFRPSLATVRGIWIIGFFAAAVLLWLSITSAPGELDITSDNARRPVQGFVPSHRGALPDASHPGGPAALHAMLTLSGCVLIFVLCGLAHRALARADRADAARQRQDIFLGTLLENLPVEVCARDMQGRVLFQSARCMLRCSQIGDSPLDMAANPEETLSSWRAKRDKALHGYSSKSAEQQCLPCGSPRLVENYFGPIRDGEEILGFLGVTTDITELKQAESRLRQALEEKDTVLKQVHHRVKNNLQVILSLIHLQEDFDRDACPSPVLTRISERIRSMALAHEQLYGSGDLASLDMAGYIPQLAQQTARSSRVPPDCTALRIPHDPVLVSTDRAIPLGLILNELFTNAFKHAFPNGRGKLEVSLERTGAKSARVIVLDHGPGLAPGFFLNTQRSLGMQLVRSLSGRIGATVNAGNSGGARFVVDFPTG